MDALPEPSDQTLVAAQDLIRIVERDAAASDATGVVLEALRADPDQRLHAGRVPASTLLKIYRRRLDHLRSIGRSVPGTEQLIEELAALSGGDVAIVSLGADAGLFLSSDLTAVVGAVAAQSGSPTG
jgi:hypothetical protein